MTDAHADNAGDSEGLVARGVSRRFGARWALAGVDVDVPRGGGLMIVGANGCGKTTLLRCLATALPIHVGQVSYGGVDLWTHRRALRSQIALLTHATRLYTDLDAHDNLRVWARLAGVEVDVRTALERVGLPVDRKDPIRTFSAGMKRRLALARSLLGEPELVLFDEPFAALDPAGRDLVMERVLELRRGGATFVMATHMPSTAAAVCEQAIVLDSGRVKWRGPAVDAAGAMSP